MDGGKVFLVGAGPGDPELLTLKGLRCLQQAHLVLHDTLANTALLKHVRPDCEIIDVGKKPGTQNRQQDETNTLMVDGARAGKTIVRLKGGDPFLFGRGGEEAEHLRKAGIVYEVVPGVTSPVSVPAYAGIPVTHRDFSPYVTIVTGHRASLDGTPEVDWGALGRLDGTLVILMGVRNRAEIARRLMDGGRPPETPVAVIQRGTLPTQRTLRTRLDELGDISAESPAVIVVGKVAGLELGWFEDRPLFGKRILVTRARDQSDRLAASLEALGAEVLEAPTIRFDPPEDWSPVDRAIAEADSFGWVVFSSVNAVDRFFERVLGTGEDISIFQNTKFAAVGPATRDRVESYHILVNLCPAVHTAEGFAVEFKEEVMDGQRVLIPRPEVAREHLANALIRSGATVEEVVVYRTVVPDDIPGTVKRALAEGELDLLTFTSSSTVRNLITLMPPLTDQKWLETPAACIGPSTSKTAGENGMNVAVSAPEDDVTIQGLVTSIRNYFLSRSSF